MPERIPPACSRREKRRSCRGRYATKGGVHDGYVRSNSLRNLRIFSDGIVGKEIVACELVLRVRPGRMHSRSLMNTGTSTHSPSRDEDEDEEQARRSLTAKKSGMLRSDGPLPHREMILAFPRGKNKKPLRRCALHWYTEIVKDKDTGHKKLPTPSLQTSMLGCLPWLLHKNFKALSHWKR